MRRKQLKKGLEQLSEEGAVQLFFDRTRLERDPVLGAVGILQFEVTQHRLKSEYGVSVSLEALPFRIARWVEPKPGVQAGNGLIPPARGCAHLVDVEGRDIMLFDREWTLGRVEEDHPGLRFVTAMQPGRSGRSADRILAHPGSLILQSSNRRKFGNAYRACQPVQRRFPVLAYWARLSLRKYPRSSTRPYHNLLGIRRRLGSDQTCPDAMAFNRNDFESNMVVGDEITWSRGAIEKHQNQATDGIDLFVL